MEPLLLRILLTLVLLADRGYEVTIWGSAWAFGDDPDDTPTPTGGPGR